MDPEEFERFLAGLNGPPSTGQKPADVYLEQQEPAESSEKRAAREAAVIDEEVQASQALGEARFSPGKAPTAEDVARVKREVAQETPSRIAEREELIARASDPRSKSRISGFQSPYAGSGLMYDDEGNLVPIEDAELTDMLLSAFGRGMVSEVYPEDEAVRQVLMGRASRKDVGISEDQDLTQTKKTNQSLYEDYTAPFIRALEAPDALTAEAIFGKFPTYDPTFDLSEVLPEGAGKERYKAYKDRESARREKEKDGIELLYFSVDEEGNPRYPEHPAYRISQIPTKAKEAAKDFFGEKFVGEVSDLQEYLTTRTLTGDPVPPELLAGMQKESRGMRSSDKSAPLLPFQEPPPSEPFFQAFPFPAPFQATERYLPTARTVSGAAIEGPVEARIVDAIAKHKGISDEFLAIPDFRKGMQEAYGESVKVPLLGEVHPAYAAGMAASVFVPAGPAEKAVVFAATKGLTLPVHLLLNSSTAKKMSAQSQARRILGQEVDGSDAPSVRSLATNKAVNPVATALEMQAVALEALEGGSKTIKADDIAARFGGNEDAVRILARALDDSGAAAKSINEIDAKALGTVARKYVVAGEAEALLRSLGGMTEKKARETLQSFAAVADRSLVPTMTKAEIEDYLKSILKTSGGAPNTKNQFMNAMYNMAAKVQDDFLKGVPASEIVTRSVKGMGTKSALFQKMLLRAVVEEGARAGKDVSSVIASAARGKPSKQKLITMVEALGEGRGRFAVARAYRDTMEASARDALMQGLPEDYRFLSGTIMVPEKSYGAAKKVLADTLEELYSITGTRSSGQTIVPRPGTSVDDLVVRVVKELGPGVLDSGPGVGRRTAKSMLEKLRNGSAMDVDELLTFTTAMGESVARDIGGTVEALTEGAQTALARGGMATRNALYVDAATGLGIGRASRAKEQSLLTLNELAHRVVAARKGNSAASILMAKPDSFVVKKAKSAAKWIEEKTGNPKFDYNPESSAVSEAFAREAQAAVSTASERIISRMTELKSQKITAEDSVSIIVKEMNDEVGAVEADRFAQSLIDSLNASGIDISTPGGVTRALAEAEQTARFMLSNVNLVAKEGRFARGEGILDEALRKTGVDDGLEGVRSMPLFQAVEAISDAVVYARKYQYNAESWVQLVKTIIPGKETQESLLSGLNLKPLSYEQIGSDLTPEFAALVGKENPIVDLTEAVRLLTEYRQKTGAKGLDPSGMLIPDIGNLKRVMELLEAANGKQVYEHSLQYTGLVDLFKSTTKESAQDAWIVGNMSWLVHQRAALDSAKIIRRLFDQNPELVLDLMPGTSLAAKGVQRVAVQSIVNDMILLEEKLTGKPADRNAYTQAINAAFDRLNGIEGPQPSALDDAVFNAVTFVETMDFNLTAENRIALATRMFSASQGGLGKVPDTGMLVNATAEDLLGYVPQHFRGMSPNLQKTLKAHVSELVSRYEIASHFQKHLKAKSPDVTVGTDVLQPSLVNVIQNGVFLGTDTSLLAPTYRALESMWKRNGLVLGSDMFAAGIDTTVLAKPMQPIIGNQFSMARTGEMGTAIDRLESAILSGRLQSNLDALSAKALAKTAKGLGGKAKQTTLMVGTAIGQIVQSVSRTMNSTLLAGGGVPGFAPLPHPIYHARNAASVSEILIATIGAEMAVKAAAAAPIGVASAVRGASSGTVRSAAAMRAKVANAILPQADDSVVVIKSPIYGNITAKELDDMMDVANIKFSRASVEAYETIAQQMAQASKMNLRTIGKDVAGKEASNLLQFQRAFNPAGMNEWMRLAEDTDNMTRRSVFAAALIDGRTIEDAALLARESLLDYGKVAATGSAASKMAQRYLLFWAFRRQSLITSVNALTDSSKGTFSRREIMGRWIRLKHDAAQGTSPEEYLFGDAYKKMRGISEDVDEFGYNMSMPSVVGEATGDLLQYLSIPTEFMYDVSENRFTEAFSDSLDLALEALEEENYNPFLTFLSKLYTDRGRDDDVGPMVPDTIVGQAMSFQNMTDMPVYEMLAKQFNWVKVTDKEGVPVVAPGKPFFTQGDSVGYQLRFRTRGDAKAYELVKLLQTAGGAGRFGDEYWRLASTIGALVPEGYHPWYRSYASTLGYIFGFETPTTKDTQLSRQVEAQKAIQRKRDRAGVP